MKLHRRGILAIALFTASHCFAEETADDLIKRTILDGDERFWHAYNACDSGTMEQFFTPDVEFYHDKGGITRGSDALLASIRKNICGSTSRHLRREAIPGSVAVFLLRDEGRVYGAIESGEHLFYISGEGRPEYVDGKARFTTLWIEKDGIFKITRELSYDHQPVVPERKEISLAEGDLGRYEGNFQAPHTGKLFVHIVDGRLVLQAGDHAYVLRPQGNDIFFVPDRDLTFEFTFTKGAISGLIVRERGAVVDTGQVALNERVKDGGIRP